MNTKQLVINVASIHMMKLSSGKGHEYITRNPGEVWQTEHGNWRGMNPDGDIESFKKKEEADDFAKGGVEKNLKEEGVEDYLKNDLDDLFEGIEKYEPIEIGMVPTSVKKAWTDVSKNYLENLQESGKYKAILKGAGDSAKAVLKTFRFSKGFKSAVRLVDKALSMWPIGVTLFGEDLRFVKEEFQSNIHKLKKTYYQRRQKIEENPDIDKKKALKILKKEFKKNYDEEKTGFEKKARQAGEYSELKNYKMMASVIANTILPKKDGFNLTAEEKKTGWQYLGHTILSTGMKAQLVAMGIFSTAALGVLGAGVAKMIIPLVIGAIVYRIAHKGLQKFIKLIRQDKQMDFHVDDLASGITTTNKLRTEFLERSRKIENDPDLSKGERERRIEEMEASLNSAISKSQKMLSKYGAEKSKSKSKGKNKKKDSNFGNILDTVIKGGLEDFIKETEDGSFDPLKEGMEAFAKDAEMTRKTRLEDRKKIEALLAEK